MPLLDRRFVWCLTLFLGLLPPLAAIADEAPAKPAAPARHWPADSVTHHSVHVGEVDISYTATAGTLPLRNDKGETQAEIFYTAFLRDNVGDSTQRPISYVFNGGPGAASAYLDIGALGPRALDFGTSGKPSPAIDRVGDNPDTWLPFTDLVFLDPVGTGFSRTTGGDNAEKKFWSVRGDLDALAQTVRLHLARIDRLASPVYLVGESYGGFRAARLAQQMARDEGVAAAGILLISPALEFRLMSGDALDLLPWALHIPAFAAVTLEAKGALTPEALVPAERFALGAYLTSLAAAPRDAETEQHFYAEIAAFIGLDEKIVARWRGRVPLSAYAKELHRGDGQVVSRYDGSISGADPDPRSDRLEDDPILDASVAPFARAFTTYARDELGFVTDLGYEMLNGEVNQHWDWQGSRGALGATDELRRALALHPKMRVLIAHGLTDLTTPYMMSRYIIDHLPANLTLSRVQLALYPGGHMMYLRAPSRHRLHDDAEAFFRR
ncbi:MAG TPA: septum formation initiator [Stellaceae bacterium]|nr:septum formation initiator [Stellaceae bacterium]